MARYVIEPERSTLHGQFSRELPPVVVVDSGDTVRFRTLDVGWGLEPPTTPTAPRRKFEPRMAGRDDGPALCGPVAVRGAQPGMTLEISIKTIEPGAWGWTWAGGDMSPLNHFLDTASEPSHLMLWQLDVAAMVGRNQHGHAVALRPFLGTIGLPPDAPGMHSGWTPRRSGGNMDCKELVAGSILYLPITVPGGLLSIGDGHARQGNGEVGGMAIECMMECVDLELRLRADMVVNGPRAWTPAGWITLGFDENLDVATHMALNSMLDLVQEQYRLHRKDALALASVVVDMQMTQLVNGVRGVHALLPHDALLNTADALI